VRLMPRLTPILRPDSPLAFNRNTSVIFRIHNVRTAAIRATPTKSLTERLLFYYAPQNFILFRTVASGRFSEWVSFHPLESFIVSLKRCSTLTI
jgi:hypothetical protein